LEAQVINPKPCGCHKNKADMIEALLKAIVVEIIISCTLHPETQNS
jgi:hypothetical protein